MHTTAETLQQSTGLILGRGPSVGPSAGLLVGPSILQGVITYLRGVVDAAPQLVHPQSLINIRILWAPPGAAFQLELEYRHIHSGVSIGKVYPACEEKGCRGIVAYLNFLYRTGKFLWARPGLWRSFLTTYPCEEASGPTSKLLACRTRLVISLCIVAPLHSTYRLIISL